MFSLVCLWLKCETRACSPDCVEARPACQSLRPRPRDLAWYIGSTASVLELGAKSALCSRRGRDLQADLSAPHRGWSFSNCEKKKVEE